MELISMIVCIVLFAWVMGDSKSKTGHYSLGWALSLAVTALVATPVVFNGFAALIENFQTSNRLSEVGAIFWMSLGVLGGVWGLIDAYRGTISDKQPSYKQTLPSSPEINQEAVKNIMIDKMSNDLQLKKCPMCAEEIKLDARKCRFCGTEFSEEVVSKHIEEAEQIANEIEKQRIQEFKQQEFIGEIKQKSDEKLDKERRAHNNRKKKTFFWLLVICIPPISFYLAGTEKHVGLAVFLLFVGTPLFMVLAIGYGYRANKEMKEAERIAIEIRRLTIQSENQEQLVILTPDHQNNEQIALFSEIRNKNYVAVKALLEKGVNPVGIVDEDGYSPIELARKINDGPVVSLLEDHGAG